MKTECSTEFLFDYSPQKQIRVDFAGGDITSDAGMMLLRQADESLTLLKEFARCISDWRTPHLIQHSLEDQIRQRVFQVCAGYEDANDCDTLRSDPALKLTCDRLPESGSDLASQPTMSRLENHITEAEIKRLQKFFVERFIGLHDTPPAEVILDIDGWDDPTHGCQQQTFFHGYYDQYMYYPVQVSEARTGLPLLVLLRPGNSHAGKGVKARLAWLLWRLKKAWADTTITVRGDCGFSLPELLRVCERVGVQYVFGIAGNDVLKRKSEDGLERARLHFLQTQTKARLFDDVYYQAGSWTAPRRVVMKCEWQEQGSNRRFVVTNCFEDAQTLYDDIYVQRGEACENRIKEFQLGLKADRLSCHAFVSNQFRLLLTQAAFWLMIRVRLAAQGTVFEKAQVNRIREQLIKLGARVRETVRRVWVHIASSCPWKDILLTLNQRLLLPLRL